MIQTVEAVVDEQGWVRLLSPVQVGGPRRALVTVLDEPPVDSVFGTACENRCVRLRRQPAWGLFQHDVKG
jgi:hypothetical protein